MSRSREPRRVRPELGGNIKRLVDPVLDRRSAGRLRQDRGVDRMTRQRVGDDVLHSGHVLDLEVEPLRLESPP